MRQTIQQTKTNAKTHKEATQMIEGKERILLILLYTGLGILYIIPTKGQTDTASMLLMMIGVSLPILAYLLTIPEIQRKWQKWV